MIGAYVRAMKNEMVYREDFKNEGHRTHNPKHDILIEKRTPSFVPGADVWSLFHHMISVMLDFAIRVYNGAIEDTGENAAHIFTVVYSSITPYLK